MDDILEWNMLRQMQACQLEILKELKKVCDANHLPFYLSFGTCLGAVRHHGFIPWDDDIDVFMRVEDIDKLIKLQNQFPPNLFIQTHERESEYGLLIVRIRNSSTTLIEADHYDRDINHGVYIDIYPLFYCEENVLRMKWMVIKSIICRLFVYNKPPMNKGKFSTMTASFILKIFPAFLKKRIAKVLYNQLITIPESKYLTIFPDVSFGKRFLSGWFKEPKYCDFEGESMPLPTNPHCYLSYEYGDYMQLPPEDQRHIHHHYVFADFDNPYLKYKGVKYCINK